MHSAQWLDSYGEQLYHVIVWNESDEIVAALQTFRFTKVSFNFYIDPPLTPNCNLLVSPPNSSHAASEQSYMRKIMEALADFLPRLNHAVSLSFPNTFIDFHPFIQKGITVKPRYTYILEIEQKSEDDLLNNLSRERRYSVRRGLREELDTYNCNDSKLLIHLASKSYNRSGGKFNASLAHTLVERSIAAGSGHVHVSSLGGRPLAAVFYLNDGKAARYILGGVDYDHAHEHAHALTLFKSIAHASEHGCTKFDFCGSMLPGIEKYFRDFGGILTPYFQIANSTRLVQLGLRLSGRSL